MAELREVLEFLEAEEAYKLVELMARVELLAKLELLSQVLELISAAEKRRIPLKRVRKVLEKMYTNCIEYLEYLASEDPSFKALHTPRELKVVGILR